MTLGVHFEGDNVNLAQPGHVKDHNTYIVMMKFIERMRFQPTTFTKKIRKRLLKPMSENFQEFKMHEFYKWLQELGNYSSAKTHPTNHPTEAADPPPGPNPAKQRKHKHSLEVWQEMKEKAKKGKYCVLCNSKACLTNKHSEATKQGKLWFRIKCLKKAKVNMTEEENNDETLDEVPDASGNMNFVPHYPENYFGEPLEPIRPVVFQSPIWVIQSGCPLTYDTDEDDSDVEEDKVSPAIQAEI
jgi:hypothetical protein